MSEDSVQVYTAQHVLPIEGEILSPGAFAVREGVILEVGTPEVLAQKYPEASVENFSDKTILPGLINAHTDLSLTHFDIAQNASFHMSDGRVLLMPWLVHLSRYKSQLTIPEQQKAVSAGLQQMKSTGVTTLGERCRYPAVLPLYQDSGFRIVCLAEIENIQRPLAQEEFEQALAMADEILHAEHPLVTAGYAPFAAYTLSKNLLKILADHALHGKLPLHLFAALSFSEMEFFYDSLGEIAAVLFREAGWQDKLPPPHRMTPVQYLQEIGFLRAKPTLTGCLHLGPTDTAILDHTESLRLFAPQAFHFLQLGDIPWKKLFQERTPWALGTLGRAWGGTLNLWDEMRKVWEGLSECGPEAVGDWVLRAATLGGARALHLESQVGSLVAGKQADFIVVDSPVGSASLAAGLITQTGVENIHRTYVAGSELFPGS